MRFFPETLIASARTEMVEAVEKLGYDALILDEADGDFAILRLLVEDGMFEIEKTVFVLVDVQGKLASLMHERETLYRNLEALLQGMLTLEIPVIWMEQIPEKMGPTIPELAAHLGGMTPIAKSCFSCCASEAFQREMRRINPKHVVVAGIEAHVCVYQTASDLLDLGFDVEVIADAVSSRSATTRDIALRKLTEIGSGVTSTESILFELMRTAEHPAFRNVLKLVK